MNVNHRATYLWILALAALAIGFAGMAAAENHENGNGGNGFVLDHFKCYETKGQSVDDLVFLQDQFGAADNTFERDIVRDPKMFCNPTQKIRGEETVTVSAPQNHLTWYRIRSVFEEKFNPKEVIVTNQFAPNGQTLKVIEPRFLAVPTQKLSVNGVNTGLGTTTQLDHFKCYAVDAAPLAPQSVQLQDQFSPANTSSAFRVVQARFLCNPVTKVHVTGFDVEVGKAVPRTEVATIGHPEDHLPCYWLTPSRNVVRNLLLNNQFGREQRLSTKEERLLCVPSQKEEQKAPPRE